jgi:hypothetical protein
MTQAIGGDERETALPAGDIEGARRTLVEAILDNLAAWAFVALAIAALFMVWATLRIVDVYVGDLPSMKP